MPLRGLVAVSFTVRSDGKEGEYRTALIEVIFTVRSDREMMPLSEISCKLE